MLSSGFAEANNIVSFDTEFPSDQVPFTDEYDYDSDSDLGDEEEAKSEVSTVVLYDMDFEFM